MFKLKLGQLEWKEFQDYKKSDSSSSIHHIQTEKDYLDHGIRCTEMPISISVLPGTYTKKEGEFTYISIDGIYKAFPLDTVINQGIYKCYFRVNRRGSVWFGVMQSEHEIPFGAWPNDPP
ncbi:MAG: hypothetical protein EZS28_055929, partial [Streblomastix strix]